MRNSINKVDPVMTLFHGVRIPNCKSSAIRTAAFSPIAIAVLYVFAPTFPGEILQSENAHCSVTLPHEKVKDIPATFKHCVPYTFNLGSTTPPSSLGFMAHVPIYEHQ